MYRRSIVFTLAATLAYGCGGSGETDPVTVDLAGVEISAESSEYGRANGGGHYGITLGDGTTLIAQFAFSGKQVGSDESATGTFHHRVEFGDLIEFRGVMTCLAIDEAEGRAWIGGIVTQNTSVREPFASGEIYQPGRDIWFRVLDQGTPGTEGDRTTFVGFEGGGGIITSAEYCAERPWPDGNARTNPLTTGNLNVLPGVSD